MTGRKLMVGFPVERDVNHWEQAHLRGEKPDIWPYGLNHLAEAVDGIAVSPWAASPLRPLDYLKGVTGNLASHRSPDLKDEKRDILITWEELTALRALAERSAGLHFSGVIWATDPVTDRRDRIRKLMVRRNLARLDGLWCLSEPQVERVSTWLGKGAPEVKYLQFGIDAEFFSYRSYPETPLIVSVGGDRDRDTETLFAALESARSALPHAEIVVQSRSTIRPPTGVAVIPYLAHSQLRELYAKASVVVIATRPNLHASGMTVSLEAMATGRPVVMTRTPGMENYVSDHETGVLVPTRSPTVLADALIDIVQNPDLGEAMGKRGRSKVEREHTSRHMARALDIILGLR